MFPFAPRTTWAWTIGTWPAGWLTGLTVAAVAAVPAVAAVAAVAGFEVEEVAAFVVDLDRPLR